MGMKHLKRNLKTKPAATARAVRRLKLAFERGIITRRVYESNLRLLTPGNRGRGDV